VSKSLTLLPRAGSLLVVAYEGQAARAPIISDKAKRDLSRFWRIEKSCTASSAILANRKKVVLHPRRFWRIGLPRGADFKKIV
jgi:hypothetical protein